MILINRDTSEIRLPVDGWFGLRKFRSKKRLFDDNSLENSYDIFRIVSLS